MFFLWKMLTSWYPNFVTRIHASSEAEVPSGFEIAGSSVTKGIYLRHRGHELKSDLSLSKANPSLLADIFGGTYFHLVRSK